MITAFSASLAGEVVNIINQQQLTIYFRKVIAMNIISTAASERRTEQIIVNRYGTPQTTKKTENTITKDTCHFEKNDTDHDTGFKDISEDLAAKISCKYDISNLTRKEYGNLLKDLRDAGVISDWEFSIGYAGYAPEGSASAGSTVPWPVWPMGETRCDFLQLYQDCIRACEQRANYFSNARTRSEANAYDHIHDIFNKMQEVSNKDESLEVEYSKQSLSEKSPLTDIEKRIVDLIEKLKQNDKFMGSTIYYLHNSDIKEAAALLVINDKGLLSDIAKRLSVSPSRAKEMLLSSDESVRRIPLLEIRGVLARKARISGLTEEEAFLDAGLAKESKYWQSTFDERMKPVKDEINSALKDAGIELDESKSYEFHIDASSLKFTVTGGDEKENALIEKIVNEQCGKVISALYMHRREDGKYNAWNVARLPKDEQAYVKKKYGIASTSPAYEKKIKQLPLAYDTLKADNHLMKRYGVHISDIQYVDGIGIVGRTEEAEAKIKDFRKEITKNFGGLYVSLIADAAKIKAGYDADIYEISDEGFERVKKYDDAGVALPSQPDEPQRFEAETPVFDDAVFSFTNGSFHVKYA